VCLV